MAARRPRRRRPLALRARAALPWLLAAAGVFAFQLPFFDRWFSFMDEGHILQYADLIANGGELYRDATVYPLPGAFWLLAAAFQVFEPSILLARWIVVIEYTLFTLLVLAWLRRLVSPPWLVIAYGLLLLYRIWSFPHWHMYSYSTTALLVLLGALLLLLRFFESGRRGWLALSGLAFGLGVLCKQDYGAAALLAVCIALPVYARKSARREALLPLIGVFLAPAALVGAAAGLHFLREGLLGDVLRLTVLNHFVGIASYEYPAFPDLFPLFGQDPALRDVRGRAQYMPALLFTADWRAMRESWLYQETAVYDFVMKIYYYGPYALVLAGGVRLRAAARGARRARATRRLSGRAPARRLRGRARPARDVQSAAGLRASDRALLAAAGARPGPRAAACSPDGRAATAFAAVALLLAGRRLRSLQRAPRRALHRALLGADRERARGCPRAARRSAGCSRTSSTTCARTRRRARPSR